MWANRVGRTTIEDRDAPWRVPCSEDNVFGILIKEQGFAMPTICPLDIGVVKDDFCFRMDVREVRIGWRGQVEDGLGHVHPFYHLCDGRILEDVEYF